MSPTNDYDRRIRRLRWTVIALFVFIIFVTILGAAVGRTYLDRRVDTAQFAISCRVDRRGFKAEARIQTLQRELGTPGAELPLTPVSPECEEK